MAEEGEVLELKPRFRNDDNLMQITAFRTLLCFHGALELGNQLMLISTDGYRAIFYGARLNNSLKPSPIDGVSQVQRCH